MRFLSALGIWSGNGLSVRAEFLVIVHLLHFIIVLVEHSRISWWSLLFLLYIEEVLPWCIRVIWTRNHIRVRWPYREAGYILLRRFIARLILLTAFGVARRLICVLIRQNACSLLPLGWIILDVEGSLSTHLWPECSVALLGQSHGVLFRIFLFTAISAFLGLHIELVAEVDEAIVVILLFWGAVEFHNACWPSPRLLHLPLFLLHAPSLALIKVSPAITRHARIHVDSLFAI